MARCLITTHDSQVSKQRSNNCRRDLLALVTGNVSQASLDTLRSDGWVVQQVEAVQNPGRWTQAASRRFPPRFWAVYTKLLVFNLTQYDTGGVGAGFGVGQGLCGMCRQGVFAV